MDTPITVWETLMPGVPSLLHLAVVKIVVPLFNEFGFETLVSAYKEIRPSIAARLTEIPPSKKKIRMAKEKLLFIPAHLRQSVYTTIIGMQQALADWKNYYSTRIYFLNSIDLKKTEFTCYWRYDGLVDSFKTAQQIVLDARINIKARFDFACEFCLEKSILSLWAEMEATDKTQFLETTGHYVTNFWVKWISDGCSIPWTQAFCDYFLKERSRCVIPNRYSFFPLLTPENREPFIHSFAFAWPIDTRLCLNVFNTKEKKYILSELYFVILVIHLHWPLQNSFLEKFEKMLSLVSDFMFKQILYMIQIYYEHEQKKDFDYLDLFVTMWSMSPQHLKKSAVKDSTFKKVLNSMLGKLSLKRKNKKLNVYHQKKWMKKTDKK